MVEAKALFGKIEIVGVRSIDNAEIVEVRSMSAKKWRQWKRYLKMCLKLRGCHSREQGLCCVSTVPSGFVPQLAETCLSLKYMAGLPLRFLWGGEEIMPASQ